MKLNGRKTESSIVSPFMFCENEYKKLSRDTFCQNSRSPRLPKQYFFNIFMEVSSMLLARRTAFSSNFLSIDWVLHLIKNGKTRKIIVWSRKRLKAYKESNLQNFLFRYSTFTIDYSRKLNRITERTSVRRNRSQIEILKHGQ